jgi:hypothetical protein
MTILRTTRRLHATAPGRLLAVFVALWINLAVAPCAMASGSDSDCPHCPPQIEETAAHHGHSGGKADNDCATQPPDCGVIDDVSLDGRASQLKLKDKTDLVIHVPPPVPELPPVALIESRSATGPPQPPGPPRTLHLLNCVFLT